MADERELLLALEVLTEGAQAPEIAEVPEALATEAFAGEAESVKKDSRRWVQGAGVQGLGIGRRTTAGRELDELALKVYVAEKKPESRIRYPAPGTVEVPEVGEVPIDVQEIGRVQPEVFTSRVRPAMPGSGLGHPDVTVGTFGCLVRRNGSDDLFILSNSHVLANEGLAQVGDAIVQPGDLDGGKVPADLLAELADFVPFQFTSQGYPNRVDAAIARVRDSQSVDELIRLLGVRPAGVSTDVRRDMRVKKVGRTTDFTIGVVQDVNYRTALRYRRPTPPHRRARVGFRDQVLCSRYTAGGDSGSIVLNEQNEAVGLHFAGSPSTSIFNRISPVLQELDVVLV